MVHQAFYIHFATMFIKVKEIIHSYTHSFIHSFVHLLNQAIQIYAQIHQVLHFLHGILKYFLQF